MHKQTGPVLKYPGSKWSIADWIISFMPPHRIYLEPFFGGGAVFFQKQPAYLETINDINSDVVNLFKVIREKPEELAYRVDFTPYAREEYFSSWERTGDDVEDARRFLVRVWQGFAGRLNTVSGWAHFRTVVNGGDIASRWDSVPERILAVAQRLKNVQIENQPANKLIPQYSSPDVLIYADPPYLMEARTGGKLYANEMTREEHEELLEMLDAHPGPVLLSGYENDLYNERLKKWQKKHRISTTQRAQKRVEVLWLNPMAADHFQQTLFEVN